MGDLVFHGRTGPEVDSQLDYNPRMTRFAIEHLPRALATYRVTPVEYLEARTWLAERDIISLIRTTEMMGAISAGYGVTLAQSDTLMALQPGDEALLLSLSFSVLLAWAEGGIVPLHEDWRCLLLEVDNPSAALSPLGTMTSQDLTSDRAD